MSNLETLDTFDIEKTSDIGVEDGADDAMSIADIIDLNAARAAFYRTLASYYFKELTQEQIEFVSSQTFEGMDCGDELIREGFDDMRKSLRKINTGTRQELAVDYAHTFLAAGNYESFAATPFESVFTSELGLLMQEARDEVYKMYCDEQMQPNPSLQVPEDHLSFELEFMALLLDRLNEALQNEDLSRAKEYAQKAKKFHEEHQANWIDDFCDMVMEVSETRFYKGVSKVTRGFVHLEGGIVDEIALAIEELA